MRRVFQSKILAALLLIIAIFSVIRFSRELSIRIKFTKQMQNLQRQIAELQEQQNNLTSLIEYLGSDAYIEAEARRKLSLGKPGEQLVVVPEIPVSHNENASRMNGNYPLLWWSYFFPYER